MKMNVSKIQAAEAQLNEAIFLFFDKANPVVIETLIGAVMGILIPLGRKNNIEAPLHNADRIKPEYKKMWIKKMLEAQNFFKHGAHDTKGVLSYTTDVLPYRIYEACYLFRHLSSDKCLKYRQSSSAIMYEVWVWLKYPHLLKDSSETHNFLRDSGMPQGLNADDFEFWRRFADMHRIREIRNKE
jgi:hypothetical protein